MNSKPPNILVYTGHSCPKLFDEIHKNLQKCLQDDRYTIYHLLASEIHRQPWMENSLLLIVSSEVLEDSTAEIFETYLKQFGNILLICSKFSDSFIESKCSQVSDNETLIPLSFKEVGDVFLYRGKYSYDNGGTVLCYDTTKNPLIHKMVCNNNILVCSEVYLDRDPALPSNYNNNDRLSILKCILSEEFNLEVKSEHSELKLTPGSYICKDEFENVQHQEKLDESSDKLLFREIKLNYFDNLIQLPVYYYKNSHHALTLNLDLYYSKLNSKVYGHRLVYFSVITSTMDVAEQLMDHEGIVIIADYQTSGKGRGSNKWISAKGCAMFTLHFTVNLCSKLGEKMTLLQHMAALSVVHSVRSQTAYKDLPLRIKWPNDIYYNEIKLGGLLVKSVIQNDVAHISIGWGINVENSHPTTCFNDIIDKYNSENSSSLPYLSVEEIVAYTLSQMEYFVNDFSECGSEKLFSLYYRYWMHNDQEVSVENLNEQGTVIGLDEYGFLKVKTNKGEILTLQPGGNRFDIMKNLIYSAS